MSGIASFLCSSLLSCFVTHATANSVGMFFCCYYVVHSHDADRVSVRKHRQNTAFCYLLPAPRTVVYSMPWAIGDETQYSARLCRCLNSFYPSALLISFILFRFFSRQYILPYNCTFNVQLRAKYSKHEWIPPAHTAYLLQASFINQAQGFRRYATKADEDTDTLTRAQKTSGRSQPLH